MQISRYLFLTVLLFACNNNSLLPDTFTAKVVGIRDGDTIEVLYDNNAIIVRLAHIDCPELKKHQPFGEKAKKFVSDICFGKIVTVHNDGKFDQYRRLIAVIINSKNENVNKELIKAGLAWHFLKYSTDTSYDKLEAIARQHKIGLWADDKPIPPWEWRRPKKLY